MSRLVRAAGVAAALLGNAGAAHAALNLVSAAGSFYTPAGAAAAAFEDADGLPGNEVFQFGEVGLPGTTTPSLLGFTSAGPATIRPGETFAVGTLLYRNGANAGNAQLVTIAFDVAASLTFEGAPLTGLSAYQFTIDNTPNIAPCAHPSATPCADVVTVESLSSFQTFTVNGQELRLYVDGFRGAGGEILSSFLGNEDTTTAATLVGRFDLPTNPSPPTPVPEPATWALLIIGFGTAGSALRRRCAVRVSPEKRPAHEGEGLRWSGSAMRASLRGAYAEIASASWVRRSQVANSRRRKASAAARLSSACAAAG